MQIIFAAHADAHADATSATHVVFAAKGGALVGSAVALDAAAGGALARAVGTARFEGDAAAFVELLAPAGVSAARVLVAGLGDPAKADAAVFERIGGAVAARLLTSGATAVTVDLTGLDGLAVALDEAAARLAHGATLRAYRFDKYRTTMKPNQHPTLAALTVVGVDTPPAAAALDAVARGVAVTRDLVSEPANILYPESFVAHVRAAAPDGLIVEAFGEDEMRRLGMGALLGVSQGSAREAQVLTLRWNGGEAGATPVVLVGKGVTFDTGGISLKQPPGMEDMKWDMGGAGAVAGAMVALAARGAKVNVVGVCGLVENMPDGLAQRPGDVVRTMSGQTVEVINTDAEGRLVLCDVLWWAQETFKPAVIVDLATLTGAMIVSLGHEHGGLFANDDGLAAQLTAAGAAVGDKLWRMPMGEAYDKMIESAIADMKNIGPREGGSITAAQFIARFIKPGVHWAHLDIAGMVWASKDDALWAKGATGYGVRLLDRFVADNFEGV